MKQETLLDRADEVVVEEIGTFDWGGLMKGLYTSEELAAVVVGDFRRIIRLCYDPRTGFLASPEHFILVKHVLLLKLEIVGLAELLSACEPEPPSPNDSAR